MPKEDCEKGDDTSTNLTNVSPKMNSKTDDTNDDTPEDEDDKVLNNQDTKWDAFASLQSNWQESSSEEEDYDNGGSEENDEMTER